VERALAEGRYRARRSSSSRSCSMIFLMTYLNRIVAPTLDGFDQSRFHRLLEALAFCAGHGLGVVSDVRYLVGAVLQGPHPVGWRVSRSATRPADP
jgi:hypothetical protein